MEILLRRIAKRPTYTIGKLYVDGVYMCDTLEDTDRGLSLDMPLDEIIKKKVYGETAIPTGTYKITLNVVSPKFSKYSFYKEYANNGRLPRLQNVPAFDGILLHVGNGGSELTYGCILVGLNKIVGLLINGKESFKKLYNTLKGQSNIIITIK